VPNLSRESTRLVIVPFAQAPIPIPAHTESVKLRDVAPTHNKVAFVIIPPDFLNSRPVVVKDIPVHKVKSSQLLPGTIDKVLERLRDPRYPPIPSLDFLHANTRALWKSSRYLELTYSQMKYLVTRPALGCTELATLEAVLKWMAANPGQVREEYQRQERTSHLLEFLDSEEKMSEPPSKRPLRSDEFLHPKSLLYQVRIDSIYESIPDDLQATLRSAVGDAIADDLITYLTDLNQQRVSSPEAAPPARPPSLLPFHVEERGYVPRPSEFIWDVERSAMDLEFTHAARRVNGRNASHYRTALSNIRMSSGVYKWGIKLLRQPANTDSVRAGLISDDSGSKEMRNSNDTSHPMISLFDGRCTNRSIAPSWVLPGVGGIVWFTYTCATGHLKITHPNGTFDYPHAIQAPVRAALTVYTAGFAELVFEDGDE